jgi:hypothetical protein
MDSSLQFFQNPDFSVEKFDHEILLYSVSSTTGVHLNETACLVWQLCGDKRSADEIIQLLEEAYPSEKASIREDVTAALSSLLDCGAILDSSV